MFSHLATDLSFKSRSWLNHLFIQVSFILSMTITGCTVVLLLWSKPTIDSYCFKSEYLFQRISTATQTQLPKFRLCGSFKFRYV